MPTFTLVFKSTNTEAEPVRRIVEAATKAEALAQAPAIQAELEITADVIEAFEENGSSARD